MPGSIGGAVRMNAGGHGSDMAASVRSATVADLVLGTIGPWSAAELAFGYRRSAVAPGHLVVDAVLDLGSANVTRVVFDPHCRFPDSNSADNSWPSDDSGDLRA